MDVSNGTVQADEDGSSVSTAVVSATDLCGNCLQTSPASVGMPICFLVREQAKSLVAIQDLEKRVKCLESSQNEVVSAISDVHNYFSADEMNQLLLSSPAAGIPMYESTPEKLKQNLFFSPLRNKLTNTKYSSSISLSPTGKTASCKYSFNKFLTPDTEISPKIQRVGSKEAPLDSDKQDSGLDSDCREQGLESNIPSNEVISSNKQSHSVQVVNRSDELLDLLDEISHKSEILCQNISAEEHASLPNISQEMNRLHHEHSELHRLLSDIKDDREELNSKIVNLECATGELALKNKTLQKDFTTLLVEKRNVEVKVQSFNEFYEKIDDTTDQSSSSDSKHPFSKSIHKVDPSVVSAVLKENNLLELQKQVLTYFMENEILRSKIDQMEQWYAAKEFEKECFEKVAKEEIQELMTENERLRIGLEEKNLQSAALKSKVRMLEQVLQSVTLENRELNLQLGETFYLHEALDVPNKTSERHSVSTTSNGLSKRLGLPAQNNGERDVAIRCSKAKVDPNASSFVNVTIEDPESSDPELTMRLEPTFNFSQRRSSTPLTFTKKHIKFSDMTNLPSVKLSPSKTQQQTTISNKHINRRLSFTMQNHCNTIPSFKEFTKAHTQQSFTKLNPHLSKPLNMIEEKPNDSKTFPFYTILEKLKANPDYKFPNKCEDRDAVNHCDENHSTSAQKCNNTSIQEGQAKEHRITSGHSKTIHKRIQDILDRITSEAEEAVV